MKAFIYFIGAIALIGALVGLGWFGLITSRPMAKYAKETDRQVYENSVAHQQGANGGIAMDCANMRNVSVPLPSRHAFASLVIQDAGAYSGSGQLSDTAQQCVADANTLLAQPLPQ